jgi:leucyl-tRNA synthetase
MDYRFREIEKKWQEKWAKEKTFRAENNSSKPKYYVLDMFPYPSGAGLHVGHPLGYIASDIMARYKRHKGFNVLHPMGYDSFGLPAEQYAIQTGQHPKITTEQNIRRYREQMDKIGFSFDWEREVRTSEPEYYKWTQWIFIQIFNSYYDTKNNCAKHISDLISEFEKNGNSLVNAACDEDTPKFTADQWKNFSEKEKSDTLMKYRLTYLGEAYVNWCPALGTVLANDEVKDGVSERGGHPVERKLMKQWSMRISAYAQRLLEGLDKIDWTESLKETQRNWIGRSEGTSLRFDVMPHISGGMRHDVIEVFTTRPDTIFGVSFVTLAPEHELVDKITTAEQKKIVDDYVTKAKNRSERERQADINKVTGVFTGVYAEHPFSGKKIPVWVGDYVLAGYGTGAVMAVPAHDERDFRFATQFGLEKQQVIEPPSPLEKGGGMRHDFEKASWDEKEGKMIHSDFLNGLEVKAAIKKAIEEIEKKGIGKGKVNFRLRDAVFGRQRYWGEPIPIYYKNGIPHAIPENELPLVLPEVDKFLPTEDGEPPLARAKNWKYKGEFDYEWTTMPGWAGSSWYFLRYMDAKNPNAIADRKIMDYWGNVDLYIGGSEHATGHLLYVRFWTKFLKDLGYIGIDEPAQKLINQGMIQGRSNLVYRVAYGVKSSEDVDLNKLKNIYISKEISHKFLAKEADVVAKVTSTVSNALKETFPNRLDILPFNVRISDTYVDVNIISNDILDVDAFKKWRPENEHAIYLYENEKFICGVIEAEKMSKSKWNVVSPDLMCEKFGADCLRLYEMFLGPLEQSKPWNTNGITGVSGFLKKLWKLYMSPSGGGGVADATGEANLSNDPPTKGELKTLHKTIKKISEDIERFSFNTSVSNFMICVNELTDQKCTKREILEPLLVLISPYAPHIAEELWERCGNDKSISTVSFPKFDETYLTEDAFNYPISFNGKTRLNIELSASLSVADIEKEVMSREEVQKHLNGATPKKIIIVPKKIVNIVV